MTPKSLWHADLDPGLDSINTERRRYTGNNVAQGLLSLHAIHSNLAIRLV